MAIWFASDRLAKRMSIFEIFVLTSQSGMAIDIAIVGKQSELMKMSHLLCVELHA